MTAPKTKRDARREAAADRYAERTMPREADAPTADELDALPPRREVGAVDADVRLRAKRVGADAARGGLGDVAHERAEVVVGHRPRIPTHAMYSGVLLPRRACECFVDFSIAASGRLDDLVILNLRSAASRRGGRWRRAPTSGPGASR